MGFLSFIFNLTTQAVLPTSIKTSKESAFKMTTVQTAAWKLPESFNLREDLSLLLPKSFMWVSDNLTVDTQKESGIHGYSTAHEHRFVP